MAALTGAIYLQFTQLEGYDFMADLQKNTAKQNLTGHHMRFWTMASITASGVMFFTGVVAWVAQARASLVLTSAFNLLAVLLAVFFMARVSMMMSLQPLLVGIVGRELSEWCTASNRASYSAALDCERAPWMNHYLRQADGCGPECQSRLELLKDLGGCVYLARICDHLEFVFAGDEPCRTVDLSGQSVPAPVQTSHALTTQQCCQFACAEQQQSCEGYVFRIAKSVLDWHGGSYITGQCSVVRVFRMEPTAPQKPTVPASLPTAPPVPTLPAALPTLPPTLPPAPTLPPLTTRRLEPSEQEAESLLFHCSKPVSFKNSTFTSQRTSWPYPLLIEGAGDYGHQHQFKSTMPGSTVCMARGKPTFLYDVLDSASTAGNLSIADCIILFIALCCGLQYAYSLATRRRGKKGLCSMVAMMLLPCLSRHTNRTRKLIHDRGASGSDISDSSDSSMLLR